MNPPYDIKNIKAIIGLGNPGQKYVNNRHNIGFRIIDEIAKKHNGSWHQTELMESTVITINETNHKIILIKPCTFMNASGKALPWLLKKGINPDNIVIAHDELEKAFGKIMLTFGGSHKGHNGLKSIMGIIGGEFWRLKFGIGRPEYKEDVPNYVLENFPIEQEKIVPEYIRQSLNILNI